jgi:hypothetical protein
MTNQKKQNGRILQAILLLVSTWFCGVPAGGAEYFYTVNFNSPPNQPGQPPATGAGQSTPSSIVFGTPFVVSSFGHLTDQPLLFSGIGYQQIQFDLGRGAPDYFVDFEFETRNLNPSLFAFDVLFDMPWAESFYLHGRGYIGVPPANSPYLPGWSDGQRHHMHIGANPTAGSWTFQLDSGAPVAGEFAGPSSDILAVRLNLSAWRAFTPDDPNVQVAVDNILVGTSVPEPSGIALTSSALGLWLLLRHQRKDWRR